MKLPTRYVTKEEYEHFINNNKSLKGENDLICGSDNQRRHAEYSGMGTYSFPHLKEKAYKIEIDIGELDG